jgi:hypothetical protein
VPSRGVRRLPVVDHEAVMDFWEPLFLATLFLVVVKALAIFRWGPGLMEVASKHDTFFEGVLDGPLVIGARLLEHLVERVGPSRRFLRVPVLGRSDEIRVGGVALRLRLVFGLLLRAPLGRRLGGRLSSALPEAACPFGRWLRPPLDPRRTWWRRPSVRSHGWESCALVCSPGLGKWCRRGKPR